MSFRRAKDNDPTVISGLVLRSYENTEMSVTSPKLLIEKLNNHCRQAMLGASEMCLLRTYYKVEIEHWFLKLLEEQETDLQRIMQHFQINATTVHQQLMRAIEHFRKGSTRDTPLFAPELISLIEKAWVLASLKFGTGQIRSGHVLAALLNEEELGASILEQVTEFRKINSSLLQKDFAEITKNTAEDVHEVSSTPGDTLQADTSQQSALKQFTFDLTEQARNKELDPVIGRDFEIRQVVDILSRHRQNNPILTGEAGVGKTAVVEGLAMEVADGNVPPSLQDIRIRLLDVGALQAGTGVRGEFEKRLKAVISEVKASPHPIVLFIDEAHTLIGAGGSAGQGDAANLLKPALARGELRTIAATTWAEYKEHFEKDAALRRRFQVVRVNEPDTESAILMMRGLADVMEKRHKVRIMEETLESTVKWSQRYITDRYLPDKAVSLIDTASARVALSQNAVPSKLQDCKRQIEFQSLELSRCEAEMKAGVDHQQRIEELRERKKTAEQRLTELEHQWEQEKELVANMISLRDQLHAEDLSPEQLEQLREDLKQRNEELLKLQGDTPLIQPLVNSQAVAEVIAGWTGIPVGKMVRDELKAVMSLKEKLQERVIGQDHALEAVAKRIQIARANLPDPRRPIGVFLLVGPSGVGKTETALTVAETLYGSDRNITVINMSEYQQDFQVTRLTGPAPGLVGYGKGGVLTEAVRRKPYSVVLLDEVEKAHVKVHDIFYQVFDKGTLQDDTGNDIDFNNTIIFLTTNIATDVIMEVCEDSTTRPDTASGLLEIVRPELLKFFKPAFLGRLTVVPYFPLGEDVLQRIARLKLGQIGKRIRENHKAEFLFDDSVVTQITGRCKEVESGARNIDHILNDTLLPEIAGHFLSRMVDDSPIRQVRVEVSEGGNFAYEVS